MMRLLRGPTCLDETGGGTIGREVGRERELRNRLDEISTGKLATATSPGVRVPVSALDASADIWAQAEAICARNGLETVSGAAVRPAAAPVSSRPRRRTDPSDRPEPPVSLAAAADRSCPRCGSAMMRRATRCGYCWLRVAPMEADGVEPAALPPSRAWWRF